MQDKTEQLVRRFRNGRIATERWARCIEVRRKVHNEIKKILEEQLIMERLKRE